MRHLRFRIDFTSADASRRPVRYANVSFCLFASVDIRRWWEGRRYLWTAAIAMRRSSQPFYVLLIFRPAHVLLRYMVSQHWAFFTAEINRFGTFRTAEQTDPYEVVRGVLSLVL